MSPLGFSFSLVFPRLGAEQAGSLEMPMEADFKKPQQKPALSSHRTRKGQPSKRETFYTKLLYSRQTLQEKLWPHATNASKGWVGSPDHHPSEAAVRFPDAPSRVVSQGQVRSHSARGDMWSWGVGGQTPGLSPWPSSTRNSPGPGCPWELGRQPGLPPHPAVTE